MVLQVKINFSSVTTAIWVKRVNLVGDVFYSMPDGQNIMSRLFGIFIMLSSPCGNVLFLFNLTCQSMHPRGVNNESSMLSLMLQ